MVFGKLQMKRFRGFQESSSNPPLQHYQRRYHPSFIHFKLSRIYNEKVVKHFLNYNLSVFTLHFFHEK